MQKGKALRRRGRRLIRSCAIAAACALGAAAEGACGEAPFSRIFGPLAVTAADTAGVAGVSLSLANPFSIDGLVSSLVEAEVDAGAAVASVRYSRLSHALYAEDRLFGAIAFEIPVSGVLIGAESGFLRRRASGYRGERSIPGRFVAVWRRARAASIRLAVPVFESGAASRVRSAWSCDASFGIIGLGVAAFSPDGLAPERRLEAAIALGARTTLGASYAWRSGELSTGVRFEIRRCIFGFAWSVHPLLGVSASAGAGRRWVW